VSGNDGDRRLVVGGGGCGVGRWLEQLIAQASSRA